MTLQRRQHAGAAVTTTLSGNISAGALSLTLASSTGWPDGSVGPFGIAIQTPAPPAQPTTIEKILCTSRSGNVVTLQTRGADGTSATSWTTGATVSHVFFGEEADDDNSHVYDTTRDDHTQLARTDGTRAFTGGVTINTGGLTVSGGGAAITGNETVSGTLGVTGATSLSTATASGTIVGSSTVTGTALIPSGLTGATAASRIVGATTVGAPVSGTFVAGDVVHDQTGAIFVCISGGTPGTWSVPVGGQVAYWQYTGGGGQIINTTHTNVALAVPVVNGLSYRVEARAYGTITGNIPTTVGASLTDSAGLLVQSPYSIFSYPAKALDTTSQFLGGNFTVITATSTTTDTITFVATAAGAGAVWNYAAGSFEILVTRIA